MAIDGLKRLKGRSEIRIPELEWNIPDVQAMEVPRLDGRPVQAKAQKATHEFLLIELADCLNGTRVATESYKSPAFAPASVRVGRHFSR